MDKPQPKQKKCQPGIRQYSTVTIVAHSYPEGVYTVPTNHCPYYSNCLSGQYTVAGVTTTRSIIPVSDEQQTIYKPEEANCKTSNSNMADLTLEPPTWPDVSLKISSIIPLKDQLDKFGLELEKHMSNHDPSAKFSCANCGKCYEEKWKLKLHMRIHSDTKLTCDICGQTLKRKGAMREHMYLKHKLGEFRSSCMCEICGEKFMNRFSSDGRVEKKDLPASDLLAQNHHVGGPQGTSYLAQLDGDPEHLVRVLGRFRLAHHRHNHFDKESLKCQICSQVYQSMQDLENHMHIHTNIDTYNCNECKLVFDTSNDLQEHVKTHKDLRNENSSGVSSKIMLHSPMDERPVIKCSKCYKILSSKQNLNYHMKTHINEKNYTCNICNESFLTPSARSVHLRVHLDKKPYICEVCDAGFLTATRLKRHEYIHTRDTSYDDRPFSCTVCTKAFRRKDTLYSHMKVHTTERLHSCSDCGRTFKKSNDRNRHRRNNCKMSLANGQPPTVYSCPICKKSFNSSASASNHLAFVHVLNKNSTEENRVPIGTDEPIISSL
uniref:C2H2-type domain-containing protein n=1 Tax=Timema genevievae TaxID=629358 RepID=A0A7R9K4S9_TIMGE|nr:unnamed protein product [Timema genevievae]